MAAFTETVQDLVTDCLREIGAVAAEETPDATDSAFVLRRLNVLVDRLGAERLTIYRTARETFALASGTGEYAIGSGATFDTVRPEWIDAGGYISSSIEYPLRLLTDKEWAKVDRKSLSTWPEVLWYDRSYPNGAINLWPVPSETATLALYLPKALTDFGDADQLTDAIAFPAGYREMLMYNTAVAIAPAYGADLSEVTRQRARETLAAVKAVNTERVMLRNVSVPGVRIRWTRSRFLGGW